jgi:hypothetical protein
LNIVVVMGDAIASITTIFSTLPVLFHTQYYIRHIFPGGAPIHKFHYSCSLAYSNWATCIHCIILLVHFLFFRTSPFPDSGFSSNSLPSGVSICHNKSSLSKYTDIQNFQFHMLWPQSVYFWVNIKWSSGTICIYKLQWFWSQQVQLQKFQIPFPYLKS